MPSGGCAWISRARAAKVGRRGAAAKAIHVHIEMLACDGHNFSFTGGKRRVGMGLANGRDHDERGESGGG